MAAMGITFTSSVTFSVRCKAGNVALIKSQSINSQATVLPTEWRLTTERKAQHESVLFIFFNTLTRLFVLQIKIFFKLTKNKIIYCST